MFRKAAVAFAIWLVPAVALAANVERTDLQIFKDIAKTVQTYQQFTIFDAVSASVNHGVVTLAGDVTMPFKRDDIARRVARVQGVTKVDDRIKVLPVSQYDDQLRVAIARALYRNATFSRYASMPYPPIHIIVDNGHVTLTGTVASDFERTTAGLLVSSVPAFSVKNDLKTDAEMRAELEKIG